LAFYAGRPNAIAVAADVFHAYPARQHGDGDRRKPVQAGQVRREQTYPAVVTHPFRDVKEQAAALYAQHLTGRGFITLAAGSIDSDQPVGRDRIPHEKCVTIERVAP
jgi:fermentation-respiration switch protein FrsA (DUF1100 family)